MSGAENIALMGARQEFLEALYFADGRDNPEHPRHAHYTGLFQAWVEHYNLHKSYEKLQRDEKLNG